MRMRSGETGTLVFNWRCAGELGLANDIVFFELAAELGAEFFGKLVGLVLHGDLNEDVGSHSYISYTTRAVFSSLPRVRVMNEGCPALSAKPPKRSDSVQESMPKSAARAAGRAGRRRSIARSPANTWRTRISMRRSPSAIRN